MKNFISFPDEALNYSIFDRFTEIARKFPDKCAIKSGSTSTTYKQLLESSYPIATEICSAVWPNTPIALLLPQGPQFISGMLGCLAAGTPYVPLDINYPVERLRLMLEVAKPALIITNKDGEEFAKSICGKDCKVLTTETLRVAFALTPRANSKSHAYLLFTSGSTGKPKGVLECHQNILHNVLRQTNSFFITADDHQSLLYTCGVYGGARDIFSAILNGATLFHYDIEAEGYEKIGSWMRESQISIYCSVATIYRYLTQYISNPTDVASVRIVKLGGEASRKSDIETFQKLFSDECIFYTGLASTETGTICQFPIRKGTPINDELLPLGQAVTGMKVHLLDLNGNTVPALTAGEIVIESEYISLGYFAQPEQTAEKFFLKDGRRYYRMGDIGRYDEKGCLWHCGRGDQLIKIRGNRIELNEVESAFLAQRELIDSIVLVRKRPDGEDYLAAYYVPGPGCEIDAVSLRNRIASKIPIFMVPSEIVRLDKLPRTVNGKVDRAALPDPFTISAADAQQGMDVWQLMVVSSWKKVLLRVNIGLDDHFFAIGGHSLGLIQIIDEVERRTGVRIPVTEFIKNPTIRNMSHLAKNSIADNVDPMLVYRDIPTEDCLVLIPGILGLSLTYRLLNEEIKGPWSIVVPQISEFDESLLSDINKLAEHIADLAILAAKGNRIHVFGYSFGGFVGLKVLEKLINKKQEIGLVGLFDSDPPFEKPDMYKLIDPVLVPEQTEYGPGTILAKSKTAMSILKKLRASWSEEFQYNGPVFFIQSSLESRERQLAQLEQWSKIYPNLKLHRLAASHRNIFNHPYATQVARILEQMLGHFATEQLPENTKPGTKAA